jgi:AcrR family transcriptional regulator
LSLGITLLANSNPVRRNRRGEDRREQVLEVAIDAFGAEGFRGATTADMATKVGLTEPGLLYHFPSKQQLLLSVLEEREAEIDKRLHERTVDAGLIRGLLDLAQRHEADPRFIRLLLVLAAESINPDHPAHDWFVARYRHAREQRARDIAHEQGAGRLPADIDPQVVARLLLAILTGLELQHLLDPESGDIAGPLEAFLALLSGGASASEPL